VEVNYIGKEFLEQRNEARRLTKKAYELIYSMEKKVEDITLNRKV
jgi:hypothetical protein